MSKEINSERNSAPTGAQDSENKLNADRPLGGAACSASSFVALCEEASHASRIASATACCWDGVDPPNGEEWLDTRDI